MNPKLLQVAYVALWCQVAEAISAGASTNAAIQSTTDGLWYGLRADEIVPGSALLYLNQSPTTAGVNPYLVILNTSDGLKHKLLAVGVPPNVTWEVEIATTLEAETPTVVTHGALSYNLNIVNDPGPIAVLVPV